jgi:hypothetical protein
VGSETFEARRRDAPRSVMVAALDTRPIRPIRGVRRRVRRRALVLVLVCADLVVKNLEEEGIRGTRNCLCMRDMNPVESITLVWIAM